MDLKYIHQELRKFNQLETSPGYEEDDLHRRLFELFVSLGGKIDAAEIANDDQVSGLKKARNLIVRIITLLQARTKRDLLYKLALWRRTAPNLDKPFGELSDLDAIAYSAYRDLVDLTGEHGVLTEFDRLR